MNSGVNAGPIERMAKCYGDRPRALCWGISAFHIQGQVARARGCGLGIVGGGWLSPGCSRPFRFMRLQLAAQSPDDSL